MRDCSAGTSASRARRRVNAFTCPPAWTQSTAALPTSVALEVLHGAFVFLGRGARCEGAEIATPPRFGVRLAGVQAVLAGAQFPNHARQWSTHAAFDAANR